MGAEVENEIVVGFVPGSAVLSRCFVHLGRYGIPLLSLSLSLVWLLLSLLLLELNWAIWLYYCVDGGGSGGGGSFKEEGIPLSRNTKGQQRIASY